MGWNLFIDDERMPPEDGREWVIARNFFQVAETISRMGSFPSHISFDHDLGLYTSTGYDIAKWLVGRDMEGGGWCFPSDFTFYVHSQNPIGKENIEGYLNSYFKHKGNMNAS